MESGWGLGLRNQQMVGKWWENGGKMVEKWWVNRGKMVVNNKRLRSKMGHELRYNDEVVHGD